MLLEVNNLSVSYPEFTLHPVSFALDAGEMLTIVGESGSGKTTLARAIACLSEPEAQVSGQVYLNGRELLAMDERARRPLRMKEFALSFQNSAEWLNPSLTLAEHLREVLCRAYRGAAMAARMEELMALVGLETADLERYPRELSGGMVQKFLLANALALNPALVLLDEPTGALDIASSRGITALIQELNRRLGTAFLVITHDMKLAADLGGGRWCSTTGTWRRRGTPAPFWTTPATPTPAACSSRRWASTRCGTCGASAPPPSPTPGSPTAAPFTAAVPRACPPAPATPRS